MIAKDVLDIMKDIVDVIEAEQTALLNPKLEDYQSIVAIKLSLTDLYEQRVKDLLHHGDFPHKISKPIFEELQEVSLRHYKAITFNEKKLNLMIRVTFEILQSIVKQVKNVNGHVKSYSKKGAQLASKQPIALSIDKTL